MNSSGRLHFTKMHGCGNDFVVIEADSVIGLDLSELARQLCDRHFGIGADGLLVIGTSDIADASMRIFNADGSEAQMCGNGIRCVGKYIYDNKLTDSLTPAVQTLSGVKRLLLHSGHDDLVDSVTVNMGAARLTADGVVSLIAGDRTFEVTPVSTGNPHCVVEVNDTMTFDVAGVGPQLENHPYWPDKANIEFVTVESAHKLRQRTWERGVGETLACGTGACAAAFAMVANGRLQWPVEVALPGGSLIIDNVDGCLMMTGPAAKVFEANL